MKLKRAKPMNRRVDHRAVSECRDLLRNFRKPDLLVNNSLASPILQSVFALSGRMQLLEMLVGAALRRLPPRDRTIVQRCDVDGERLASVADDLGISERHLYRERRRIFKSLAAIFAGCSKDLRRIQFEGTDELVAQLRTARVLEENGADKAAAAVIQKLLGESAESSLKSHLLLQLAQLHARAGRFAKAKEFLNSAHVLAKSADVDQPSLSAEIHSTRAYIFEWCGQGDAIVAQEAADAARILLRDGAFRYDEKSASCLIRALLLCGLAYTSSGQGRDIESVAQQAANVFGLLRRPDEEAQMGIMSLAALRSSNLGDILGAVANFSEAANVARLAGFTLSSVVHLMNLSSVYILQNEPEIGVKLLRDALPIVRELGNANILLMVLVELANTYSFIGKYQDAQELLLEAAKLRTENEMARAAMICTSAQVNVGVQRFAESLEEARMAEAVFCALGKPALIGTPLRLQAQAYMGLGERRAAYRTISDAIGVLSTRHSEIMLQRAHRVLEQVKGNRPLLPAIRSTRH